MSVQIDFDERDVRAAGEYLFVDETALDLYHVYSEDGRQHLVDFRTGMCTCEDAQYRTPEDGCKHYRRVEMQLGQRSIPPGVHVDPLLEAAREAIDA
ncbi:hypothetical protein ACFQH6_20630 [Halobacteriaceae archaeon GCM10025711]